MAEQDNIDIARTLYEQLITVEKVDLLMGPYATGAILSAMGVAQRYDKMLIHHTFGIPNLAKYERQFPTWSLGPDPANTFTNNLVDALQSTGKPPKTVAVVTSKFPSIHFMALGAREVFKKRGIQEVLFLEWEFGNRDFGPIAARVKDAKPDFVYVGAIGLEGNQLLDAMKKIDYAPPIHYYMYPSPGPMVKSPEAFWVGVRRGSRSLVHMDGMMCTCRAGSARVQFSTWRCLMCGRASPIARAVFSNSACRCAGVILRNRLAGCSQ